MKYLDVVSAEHELADDDAADAAGGADDEDGDVLRAGHGELAHGPAAEEDGGVLLGHSGGGGAGHLAEPRELAPHLIEHLPGAPAEPTGFTITSSSATIPLPPPPFAASSGAPPFLASAGSAAASSAVDSDLVAFLDRRFRDLRGFAAAVSLSSVADTGTSLALATKRQELRRLPLPRGRPRKAEEVDAQWAAAMAANNLDLSLS